LQRIRSRITYANVMSTIAVVVSLGGATAFAATTLGRNSVGPRQLRKNAVTGVKVKDGSLTGKDLRAGTLGQVPSAARADRADTATSIAAPEAPHVVGAPGELAFAGTWVGSAGAPVSFYEDREGVVHLAGRARRPAVKAADQTILTLPPAYRPAHISLFTAATESGPSTVFVNPAGEVITVSDSKPEISLDGFSWRVGG
jgi:hypothetical protein